MAFREWDLLSISLIAGNRVRKLFSGLAVTGYLLEQALEFCKYYGLEFDAVNDNVPETKMKMGNMRKVFANVYYDDNARIVYEEFPK